MKNLDLNNPDTIRKFQSVLNETFEKKIYESERNNILNGIGKRNIHSIANLFEGISDKLFASDQGKKLIRKYVKAINENSDIKKAYQFRNAMMNPATNDVDTYLNEAISISSINKKSYDEGREKLGQILREMVDLADIENVKILLLLSENEDLGNAEEYIISNKKNFKNLSEYVFNRAIVREFVETNRKPVNDGAEEQRTSAELIGELNEALKSLEGWQRDAMVRVTENRLARIGEDKLFEEFKNECLKTMEEKIEESDDTGEISKLTVMKSQLSERKYDKNNFMNDIMNLAELKQTLSE